MAGQNSAGWVPSVHSCVWPLREWLSCPDVSGFFQPLCAGRRGRRQQGGHLMAGCVHAGALFHKNRVKLIRNKILKYPVFLEFIINSWIPSCDCANVEEVALWLARYAGCPKSAEPYREALRLMRWASIPHHRVSECKPPTTHKMSDRFRFSFYCAVIPRLFAGHFSQIQLVIPNVFFLMEFWKNYLRFCALSEGP